MMNNNLCHSLLLLRYKWLLEVTIMNVSLTPRLEGYVKQKVSTGLYSSSSEVIREGLRLLEERDSIKQMKLQALRQEIGVGVESLDSGKGRPFDKDAIKAKGRVTLDNNQ